MKHTVIFPIAALVGAPFLQAQNPSPGPEKWEMKLHLPEDHGGTSDTEMKDGWIVASKAANRQLGPKFKDGAVSAEFKGLGTGSLSLRDSAATGYGLRRDAQGVDLRYETFSPGKYAFKSVGHFNAPAPAPEEAYKLELRIIGATVIVKFDEKEVIRIVDEQIRKSDPSALLDPKIFLNKISAKNVAVLNLEGAAIPSVSTPVAVTTVPKPIPQAPPNIPVPAPATAPIPQPISIVPQQVAAVKPAKSVIKMDVNQTDEDIKATISKPNCRGTASKYTYTPSVSLGADADGGTPSFRFYLITKTTAMVDQSLAPKNTGQGGFQLIKTGGRLMKETSIKELASVKIVTGKEIIKPSNLDSMLWKCPCCKGDPYTTPIGWYAELLVDGKAICKTQSKLEPEATQALQKYFQDRK